MAETIKVKITREAIKQRILADPASGIGCGEVQPCVRMEVEQITNVAGEVMSELVADGTVCYAEFYEPAHTNLDGYMLTKDVDTAYVVKIVKACEGCALRVYMPSAKYQMPVERDRFALAWAGALAAALATGIVFRYRGCFYSSAEACQQAKEVWEATHPRKGAK